ncbi:MAG: hypothetical protein ACRDTA_14560 [Pseudonocardiaceae bacterium]
MLAFAGVLFQAVLVQYTGGGIDDSTLLALHRIWNVIAFMGPTLPMVEVLDLGSFLVSCAWFTAVSVHAWTRRASSTPRRRSTAQLTTNRALAQLTGS